MTSLRAALSGTEVFFSAPRAASRAPAFRPLSAVFFRAASREPRARAHTYRCHAIVYKQASKQPVTRLWLSLPHAAVQVFVSKSARSARSAGQRERVSARTREQAQERESKGGGKLESPKASKPEGFHFVRCRTNVVRI